MSIYMNHVSALVLGYLLDILIGDPRWFPHPVRFIGWLIDKEEALLRRAFSEKNLRVAGVVLLAMTTVISLSVLALIMRGLYLLGPAWYFLGQVLFSWLFLASRSLAVEAEAVNDALGVSLKEGRRRVGYIVGRDVSELSEEEVVKATVETVAENTTDGIVSPLIYMLLGGVYLGVVFKAVSTLDSMVGYRNEKYEDLGCASAKMDDVLNYLPARITGFLIVAAAGILGMDVKNSYLILIRDHANHKSPNCAWSESAVAGALGIQLGGTHMYFGKEVYKPTIGDTGRAVEPKDIARTNKLMYMTSLLVLCLLTPIAYSLFFL